VPCAVSTFDVGMSNVTKDVDILDSQVLRNTVSRKLQNLVAFVMISSFFFRETAMEFWGM